MSNPIDALNSYLTNFVRPKEEEKAKNQCIVLADMCKDALEHEV